MSTRLAVGVGGLVVAWGALRIFAKGERHDGSIRRAYPRGLMKGDKVCMNQASGTTMMLWMRVRVYAHCMVLGCVVLV